jgi:VWFA-related protein
MIILTFLLIAQELQHEAIAINIEVPVRVFKGSKFVDNLTIKDFEVYEDGKLQKIEAVYLIKKTNIEREETEMEKEDARKILAPALSRNFVLFFEIIDYLPKIKEAVDYFFENVLSPEDTLMVVTPVKSYKFNKKALEIAPRQEIATRLNEVLRKDITLGGQEFKNMLRDYENIFLSEFPEDQKFSIMRIKIREIKNFRYVEEKKIQDFADFLKNMEGQKHVFLFYQKVLLPFPEIAFETREYLDLMAEVTSLASFNIEKIKKVFADSSISVHFLYITKTGQRDRSIGRLRPTELKMQDMSTDIFSTFKEISHATGGLVDSSTNIASSLERAVNASENYYLLYYTPKDYKADGKFREIKVKVKNKNYRIFHRSGYFSD